VASNAAQQTGAVAPHLDARAPQLFRRRDEGFTLVEVIWALLLIGLIAMGALGLFLNGMKTVAHVQRQQIAVSLASSAMDQARSVAGGPVNAAGTSGLVKGRSQSAVQAVWNEATAADSVDTADMTMVWDPESGLTTADQWVPVRTTATISSQPFTIDTLIGTCFRLRATSATSQNCVATNPSPSTDTYVQLYRVRVVVRWDEGEAAKGAQTYRVSSLIDPSADATWNTAVEPFAYDDEFSVTAGTPASFHAIVINDSVDYDVSGSTSPIIGLTAPTPNQTGAAPGPATVAAGVGAEINGVVFKPPSNRSGLMTFRYRVQGSSGQISAEQAIVSVHVLPNPVADSGTATIQVEPGTSTDITDVMLANDIGVTNLTPATRKTSIVPVWDRAVDMFSTEEVSAATEAARVNDAANLAANGISVNSSGRVFFESPSGNNVATTFYYYLVDDPISGAGQRFPSAEAVAVRVVTQEVPLTVAPMTHTVNGTTNQTWYNINWRALTTPNNLPGTRILVESITGPAGVSNNQVRIDGATGLGTGSTLDFRTTANTLGYYVLTYRVVSPAGKVSATSSTLTIGVLPVGANASVASTVSTVTNASPQTFTVVPPASWITTTNIGIETVGITTTGTCSNLTRPANQPLQVRVTFTGSNRACSISFRLITTSPTISPALRSTATYTLTVNRK